MCTLVALDLALTNIAVALLAVAIQQCIVATNPAFTVTIESIVRWVSELVRQEGRKEGRFHGLDDFGTLHITAMHPIACSLAYPLAYLVRRKLAHPMIYLVIVFLCTGPVVAQIGAPADDINVIGILVQVRVRVWIRVRVPVRANPNTPHPRSHPKPNPHRHSHPPPSP